MSQALAYAAQSPTSPLAPFTIERRAPGQTDVVIDILHCGVCHSDLHTARGEWAGVNFPAVPGHEIVGRVTAVGSLVRCGPARPGQQRLPCSRGRLSNGAAANRW